MADGGLNERNDSRWVSEFLPESVFGILDIARGLHPGSEAEHIQRATRVYEFCMSLEAQGGVLSTTDMQNVRLTRELSLGGLERMIHLGVCLDAESAAALKRIKEWFATEENPGLVDQEAMEVIISHYGRLLTADGNRTQFLAIYRDGSVEKVDPFNLSEKI